MNEIELISNLTDKIKPNHQYLATIPLEPIFLKIDNLIYDVEQSIRFELMDFDNE